MDLFYDFKLKKDKIGICAVVFIKPCLLELSKERSLQQLVVEYIKDKAPHAYKIDVVLEPLHILSMENPSTP